MPQRGRVGFEVEPDGQAIIYVEKGVACDSPSPSIRRWLAEGRLRFDSFDELCGWLHGDLAAAYATAGATVADLSTPQQNDLQTRRPPGDERLPVVGREQEIDDAETTLSRRQANCGVLFAGPPGVGKSAVLRELAWRWQERGDRQVAGVIHAAQIIAETPIPSLRNRRLQELFEKARGLGPSALLAIEDLPLLCGWQVLDDRGSVRAADHACSGIW